MSRFVQQMAWIGVVLTAAGCGSSTGSNDASNSSMDDMARMLDQPKAAAPAQPTAEPAQSAAEPATAAAPSEPPAPAAQPDGPRASEVVTEPGQAQVVGKQKYRNTVEGPLEYIGAAATVRTLAIDRALGWQIDSAMQSYWGTTGEYPKDAAEFKKEIIDKNEIKLPELRLGQAYFYDPSDHQLKIVERVGEPPADGQGPTQ